MDSMHLLLTITLLSYVQTKKMFIKVILVNVRNWKM